MSNFPHPSHPSSASSSHHSRGSNVTFKTKRSQLPKLVSVKSCSSSFKGEKPTRKVPNFSGNFHVFKNSLTEFRQQTSLSSTVPFPRTITSLPNVPTCIPSSMNHHMRLVSSQDNLNQEQMEPFNLYSTKRLIGLCASLSSSTHSSTTEINASRQQIATQPSDKVTNLQSDHEMEHEAEND